MAPQETPKVKGFTDSDKRAKKTSRLWKQAHSEEDVADPSSFANGRYRIIRELGQGGMAVVYLALDERLKRYVVLKMPLPNLRRSAPLKPRLNNEWRIGARLNNPYAATVFDIGEESDGDDGTIPYIVMEYIEGMDIAKCLAESEAIPARAASRIVVKILLCLEQLHAQRIIHRDIKPENIRLRFADGVPKLMDFGAAHVEEASGRTILRANLTKLGTTIGTRGYMSIEQKMGEPLDERADLYAIAATLYAMITGNPPVPPAHPDLYELDADDERFRAVPELLRPIIIGATRTNRGDRSYRNAGQMVEAIEAALARMEPDRSSEFYAWLKRQGEEAGPVEPHVTMVPNLPPLQVEDVDNAALAPQALSGPWFEEAVLKTQSPEAVATAPRRRVWPYMAAAAAVVAVAFGGYVLTQQDPPIAQSDLMSPSQEDVVGSQAEAAASDPLPPLSLDASQVAAEPVVPASKAPTPRETPRRSAPDPTRTAARPATAALEAPKPEPAPEASPTGRFQASGDADRVRLRGRNGTHGPGEVPVGTYALEASFDGGASFVEFGSYTIQNGGTISVSCNKDFGNCR